MPSKTVNAVRGVVLLVLLLLSLLLIGGGCGRGDPPGDGGIQLFYDVNVDDAVAIGLESLSSVEITTTRVTALMGSRQHDGDHDASSAQPTSRGCALRHGAGLHHPASHLPIGRALSFQGRHHGRRSRAERAKYRLEGDRGRGGGSQWLRGDRRARNGHPTLHESR
jgi:hypothetical protein